MAVRLIVLFLERPLIKRTLAARTNKVLWVELLVHGGYAAAGDRLTTAGAERAALGVEVRLAVRHTLVVKEATRTERRATFLKITEYRNVTTGNGFKS